MPAPPLRRFVAAAHGYRSPPSPTGIHRGLPSRHLTLVVELASPLGVTPAAGAPVHAHGVVGGLHTKPALIDASVPQEGLHYALDPLAAQRLLGVPAAELAGLAVDLRALLGPGADELVERLQATGSWRERFAVMDEALLRRVDTESAAVPAEVVEARRLVTARRGQVRVAELAAHVGWSRRHLSERFRAATGVTPKQAARVARFEAARQLLLAPARPPLVEIALRCGYVDQPHLAREWRGLAGCSLTSWMREELPFVHDSDPSQPSRSRHDDFAQP